MKKGSTKTQVIIVAGLALVIILLSVFLGIYLNKKNHDYLVMSDISQIRSALSLSFSYNNFYPKTQTTVELNNSYLKTEKLCKKGFVIYNEKCNITILNKIPNTFSKEKYEYTSINGKQYFIEFNLLTDNKKLGLVKGVNCATEIGLFNGQCFK